MAEMNLESIQAEAKKLGQAGVEEKLDQLIKKYEELNDNPENGRDDAKPEEAEQIIIMAEVYPELEKKMKRMEELYSTLSSKINPIEGQQVNK